MMLARFPTPLVLLLATACVLATVAFAPVFIWVAWLIPAGIGLGIRRDNPGKAGALYALGAVLGVLLLVVLVGMGPGTPTTTFDPGRAPHQFR